ncbi:MAG: DNA cytosine methyltransferase [Patescibacteria group bacterium]|nr:DNA cytosine methyltransferase [Patescibacteria group bacterium]
MPELVLSVFPGIDLLGRAFEEEGFCVVRGPDVLWGGDIHTFHPPAGVFDGVIGGPPCQSFSVTRNMLDAQGIPPEFGNLIPEFERVISEARPKWFVMENVAKAPCPHVTDYLVESGVFDNRLFGASQHRERLICVGRRGQSSHTLHLLFMEWSSINGEWKHTVTARHQGARRERTKGDTVWYSIPDAIEVQGLPSSFLEGAPLTRQGKLKAIANGVPLPMGRAIARAIKRAMEADRAEAR